MDKEYFQTLTNPEEKAMYMREITKQRKKMWDDANSEKVFVYRRKNTLKRCIKLCCVPTPASIKKYEFTEEELLPIFKSSWTNRFPEATDIQGIEV